MKKSQTYQGDCEANSKYYCPCCTVKYMYLDDLKKHVDRAHSKADIPIVASANNLRMCAHANCAHNGILSYFTKYGLAVHMSKTHKTESMDRNSLCSSASIPTRAAMSKRFHDSNNPFSDLSDDNDDEDDASIASSPVVQPAFTTADSLSKEDHSTSRGTTRDFGKITRKSTRSSSKVASPALQQPRTRKGSLSDSDYSVGDDTSVDSDDNKISSKPKKSHFAKKAGGGQRYLLKAKDRPVHLRGLTSSDGTSTDQPILSVEGAANDSTESGVLPTTGPDLEAGETQSVDRLIVYDPFALTIKRLSMDECETRFLGVRQERLMKLHHSSFAYIQDIIIKLLEILVGNTLVSTDLEDDTVIDKDDTRSATIALLLLPALVRMLQVKSTTTEESSSLRDTTISMAKLPHLELVYTIINKFEALNAATSRSNSTSTATSTTRMSSEKLNAKLRFHVETNRLSKAMACLEQYKAPLEVSNRFTLEETIEISDRLHPPADVILDTIADVSIPPTSLNITQESITKILLKLPTGSSEGVDSWNFSLFQKVLLYKKNSSKLIPLLVSLVELAYKGKLAHAKLWCMSRLILIRKRDLSPRPIAIGSAWYRFIGRAILSIVGEPIGRLLAPLQLAVGIKDGCAIAAKIHQIARNDPNLATISVDLSNAFNRMRRRTILEGLQEYAPHLVNFYQWGYGAPCSLRNHDGNLIGVSATGTRQGDPLSMLFYSVGLQKALVEVQDAIKPNSAIVQSYADDIGVITPVNSLHKVHHLLISVLQNHNLPVNINKTKVIVDRDVVIPPIDDTSTTSEGNWIDLPELSYSGSVLGITVGDPMAVSASIDIVHKTILDKIEMINDVPCDIAFLLLKYCINTIPIYQHRLYAPEVSKPSIVDAAVNQALDNILNVSLSDYSQVLRALPGYLGGLGIPSHGAHFSCILFDTLQERCLVWLKQFYTTLLPIYQSSKVVLPNACLGKVDSDDSRSPKVRTRTINKKIFGGLLDHLSHPAHLHLHPYAATLRSSAFRGSGEIFGFSYIGKRIEPHLFREVLRHRLLVPVVLEPVNHCLCGNGDHPALIASYHPMNCAKSSYDKIRRHDGIRDALIRFIKSVEPRAVVTKEALLNEDTSNERSDIRAVLPSGTFQIDVTITNPAQLDCLPSLRSQFTIASVLDEGGSNIQRSAATVDNFAATRAEKDKMYKYRNHNVTAFAIESTGRFGKVAIEFLDKIEKIVRSPETEGRPPSISVARKRFHAEIMLFTSIYNAKTRDKGRYNLCFQYPTPPAERLD